MSKINFQDHFWKLQTMPDHSRRSKKAPMTLEWPKNVIEEMTEVLLSLLYKLCTFHTYFQSPLIFKIPIKICFRMINKYFVFGKELYGKKKKDPQWKNHKVLMKNLKKRRKTDQCAQCDLKINPINPIYRWQGTELTCFSPSLLLIHTIKLVFKKF